MALIKEISWGAIMALDLTRAQTDVVALVSQGLANKEISYRLGIEEATVKAHIGQAAKRLELRNRVHLAVWYITRELEQVQVRALRLCASMQDDATLSSAE